MKLVKNIAVRAVALLLFFAMILAVILYQAGVYDLSFIDRPLPPVTTGEPSNTTVPITTEQITTTVPPTESMVPPPSIDMTPEEFLATIVTLTALQEQGYVISGAPYSSGSRLARLELTLGGESFSLRSHTVKNKVLQRQSNGLLAVKTVSTTEALPAVRLYDGMIFVDNGSSYTIYNNEGELLEKKFTGTLTMARSMNGLAVVTIGGQYYELDPEKGILRTAIAAEEVDFKALLFDAPSYYAAQGTVALYPFSAEVDVLVSLGDDPSQIVIEMQGQVAQAAEDDVPAVQESEQTTEPTTTEPMTTEPTVTEPMTTEPTTTEPIPTEPISTEPTTTEPTPTEPATTEPTPTEPTPTEPTSTEPTTTEPTTTEPTPTEPTPTKPTTTEPVTTKPTTTEPVTTEPTTTEPTTTLPDGVFESDGQYYQMVKAVRWGYCDAEGNVVIEPQYVMAYDFTSDGLAAVIDEEDNLFFINTEGKETVSLRNDVYVRPPEFNYARYRQVYERALQDDLGNLGMYYYDHGYVMVRYCLRGDTYLTRLYVNENRLLDTQGNVVDLPVNYTLEGYSDGVMLLKKGDRYAYMSTDGSWVAPAVYLDASPFLGGLAAVVDEDGNYGMIDREGNVVLPFCFDYISNVSDGVIAAYREEGGWQFYAVTEKE